MSKASQSYEMMRKEMRFHDSFADEYDEALRLGRKYSRLANNRRINEVVDLIQDGNAQILEVGCGTGHITIPLVQKMNSCSKLFAIDISKKMIYINKSSLDKSTKVLHIQGSGTEMPLKKNAFNLILCIATLHHIPKYHRVIKEFERVLVPGGRIYLEEPIVTPFQLQWKIRKLLGHKPVKSPYERRFKGFHRIDLLRHLERCMSVEQVSFRGFLGRLFSWVRNEKLEKILFRLDSLIERLSVLYRRFSTTTVVAKKRH